MEVLITSDLTKLPEDVRVLADETRPLLPGTTFFEQRYTVATLVNRLAAGVGMILGGVVLIAVGVRMLVEDHRHPTVYTDKVTGPDWWVIGFGAVMGFAGWLFLESLREGWAMNRRQAAGGHTRHGIFLLPHALVSRSSFDTTVIPRAFFRGLNGGSVQYEHMGKVKSFSLPSTLVGASFAEMEAAIVAWSQRPEAS